MRDNGLGLIRYRGTIAALDEAQTEREIVDIVRDRLARLTPKELLPLPQDCWPGRFRDHDDIAEYAMRLARRRRLAPELNSALIDDVFNVLMHASTRIAVLHAPAPRSQGTGIEPSVRR